MRRAIARQGFGELGHGASQGVRSSRRMAKTVAQLRRRVTHLGFEAVRRPGVMFLHSLRKIPVVRNRVIPALLKEELDGIPAPQTRSMPSAGSSSDSRKHVGPIVIGPWVGEVGFELLYWIPFLNCALKHLQARGSPAHRRVARRCGPVVPPSHERVPGRVQPVHARRISTGERGALETRRDTRSSTASSRWITDIVERAKQKAGLPQAELLHPSLMYRIAPLLLVREGRHRSAERSTPTIGVLHQSSAARR